MKIRGTSYISLTPAEANVVDSGGERENEPDDSSPGKTIYTAVMWESQSGVRDRPRTEERSLGVLELDPFLTLALCADLSYLTDLAQREVSAMHLNSNPLQI